MKPRFGQAARTALAGILALSATIAHPDPDRLRSQARCQPGIVYQDGSKGAAVTTYSREQARQTCNSEASCGASARSTGQKRKCNPPRGNGGQTGDNGGDSGVDIIGPAIALGTAITIGAMIGQMDKWATAEELDANGPRFPNHQEFGRFQMQGYAARGWPFLVDFQTDPDATTWLELKYKGGERQEIFVAGPGSKGRKTELIHLPGNAGPPGVARYAIYSAVVRPGRTPEARPLRIFALGAGPNAVGSLDLTAGQFDPLQNDARAFAHSWRGFPVANAPAARLIRASFFQQTDSLLGSYLTITAFGPQNASSPADVQWAVAAHRTFEKSQVEVLRVPEEDGDYVLVSLGQGPLYPQRPMSGTWADLPMPRRGVGPGTYTLQARAWITSGGGGDWTGAYAPEYVYIK